MKQEEVATLEALQKADADVERLMAEERIARRVYQTAFRNAQRMFPRLNLQQKYQLADVDRSNED